MWSPTAGTDFNKSIAKSNFHISDLFTGPYIPFIPGPEPASYLKIRYLKGKRDPA